MAVGDNVYFDCQDKGASGKMSNVRIDPKQIKGSKKVAKRVNIHNAVYSPIDPSTVYGCSSDGRILVVRGTQLQENLSFGAHAAACTAINVQEHEGHLYFFTSGKDKQICMLILKEGKI